MLAESIKNPSFHRTTGIGFLCKDRFSIVPFQNTLARFGIRMCSKFEFRFLRFYFWSGFCAVAAPSSNSNQALAFIILLFYSKMELAPCIDAYKAINIISFMYVYLVFYCSFPSILIFLSKIWYRYWMASIDT